MQLARQLQRPARASASASASAALSPLQRPLCLGRGRVLVAPSSSSSSSQGPQGDAAAAPPAGVVAQDPLTYTHLLVALIDSNPYLDSNSQAAVAAAASLASSHASCEKISFLLIDEPGTGSADSAGADASVRLKTVAWHLRERGCAVPFDFLERPVGEKGAASALVGDVADEVGADLLLLSSAGVHAGHVDANLLAEFVSCPVLLLP